MYLGHLIQGKRTTISYKNHKIKKKKKNEWIKIENTHKAIIDEQTFNKVQTTIKERRKPLKDTGAVHIFSGKVFCYECEHSMRKKNSGRHQYLVCSNNHNGYNNCTNKSSIRYDALENIVTKALNKKIKKYYDKNELNNLYFNNKENLFTNKIKILEMQKESIKKDICKIKNYLTALYEDKVNGVITTKQFKELIVYYNDNENTYNRRIESINNEINYYKMKSKNIKDIKRIFSKYQNFNNLNRVIVDEFIDKIYISKLNKSTNTRNIQIKWNFK